MSLFEKFITEGNGMADELAKEEAMMDGGVMAQIRASTVQQSREVLYAALRCAASFHRPVEGWQDCELQHKPKEKWTFVDKKVEPKKHRTEWCAAASKYRCARCGIRRRSTKIKHPRNTRSVQGGWRRIPNVS